MDPVTGLVSSVAGPIIGGLFAASAAKRARKDALDDQSKQFSRLRDAAIRGGFNPLTVLQATGGGGFGNLPSSAPPLASIELLTGAISSGIDELNGEAGRRRAADDLAMDLTKVQIEQSHALTLARNRVAATPATLGQRSIALPSGPPPMEVVNKYIRIFNPQTGQYFTQTNPDLLDAGVNETITGEVVMTANETAQHQLGKNGGWSSIADKANDWLQSWHGYQIPSVPRAAPPRMVFAPSYGPQNDWAAKNAADFMKNNPDF